MADLKLRVDLARDWRGHPVDLPSPITVTLERMEDALHVAIDAPYFGNAPPDARPGSTDELWEHEVVEVFLLGEEERYLEMEFGPHGHYLLLAFEGERERVREHLPCDYDAVIEGARWRAGARVLLEHLPELLTHYNVCAIHDVQDASRRYMALHHVEANEPDFHRLEAFLPIIL